MPISCEMTNIHERHVRVARDWENFKNNEGKRGKKKKKQSWKRHSIYHESKNHYEVLKTDGNKRCAQSCSTCEASTAASESFR